MTFNQLSKYNDKSIRIEKISKSKSPRLEGSPQRKGVCTKVYITKPKKPNSAKRQVAKILLSTKRYTVGYIPGSGHSLQQHSVVMIRGGRVPDLPGVKYHIVRNKYDFTTPEKFLRKSRRSKFSIKKLKNDK